MVENYRRKPPLRRWPTAVFMHFIGIAQINALTVLMMNRDMEAGQVKKSMRREINYSIGEALAKQRVQKRSLAHRRLNCIRTASETHQLAAVQ